MFKISEHSIPTLAGDVRNLVDATDVALSMHSQILSSAIEATRASDLPLSASQRVLTDIAAGLNGMIDTRERIRKAVATMTAIGRQTVHKEKMDGCPGGVPIRGLQEPVELSL